MTDKEKDAHIQESNPVTMHLKDQHLDHMTNKGTVL